MQTFFSEYSLLHTFLKSHSKESRCHCALTFAEDSDDKYELSSNAINVICTHCNEKHMASKQVQEQCNQVFLVLYVCAHPLSGEMGVVLSVGVSSFTIFVPRNKTKHTH